MPPDVLTHQFDASVGVDRSRGVHRTGLVEQSLFTSYHVGQRQHGGHWYVDQFRGIEGGQSLDEIVESLIATQSATRRGVTEPWSRFRSPSTGLDRDHVESTLDGRTIGAVPHATNRMAVQQTVGETESGRQLVVVSWCSHRRGDEFTIETDRHGLFDHETIGCTTRCITVDLDDENGVDPLTSHVVKATVRKVAPDEQTPDDDPSWDLIRPAGQTAYNTRPIESPDRPILEARERDPLIAADPDGTSWLVTPDPSTVTNRDDRGTVALYGFVTFIAAVVVGLIVTVAVDRPSDTSPITTPIVSFAPRPSAPPTSAVGDTTAPDGDTAIAEPTEGSDSTSTTTSVVPADSSVGAPIVVATNDGVFRESSVGTTRIIDGAFDVIVPVGDGSYLAQARSGRFVEPLDTTILRISPGGVPSRILEPSETEDEWFTLHDVGVRNGSFVAVVTVSRGSLSNDSVDEVILFSLDSLERRSVLTRDAWRSTLSHLTIGDDVLVGEILDESSSGEITNRPVLLNLVESDDRIDTVVIPPTPFGLADSYSGCFVCPRVFGVDQDGRRLAWVEGDLLVIVDLASRQRLLTVSLPQGTGERVASLEIGATGVLLNRRLGIDGPYQKALVVDGNGSIGVSNFFGRAAFPNDLTR